jgi:hypothetical protein
MSMGWRLSWWHHGRRCIKICRRRQSNQISPLFFTKSSTSHFTNYSFIQLPRQCLSMINIIPVNENKIFLCLLIIRLHITGFCMSLDPPNPFSAIRS